METATRYLILASLLGAAGCSSDVGDGASPAQSSTAPGGSIDPSTGLPADPGTGMAPVDPVTGMPVDPVTGMPVDPVTGMPVDPVAGMPTDPDTMDPDSTLPPGETECEPGIPPTSQVPRLLNREYDAAIRDLLDVTTVSGNPPSDSLSDDYDGPIDTFAWNAYQDVAARLSAEVIAGPNRDKFISCDPATVATCYEDTIRAFGRKAFRRPLSDEEVASFMALTTIQPAGTPDEIAAALLEAFLVSPSFIAVPEMAAQSEGTAFKLSSHEVATRLSLMLWGRLPDDELNAAADADQLQDPAQILAQAERMLSMRDKVGPQVAGAHRAYLVMDEASHWWKISHDSGQFPEYSDALRPTLQAELDAFFEEIAFSGGSFEDVFMSNVAFVNQDTAALYGLDPSEYGTELARVELTDRPGFLTRAGFLSSFSSPEATSPILRGAFITVNLLGVDPGAPDPTVLGTPIPPGDYTTRRQQIEALTAPDPCSGCHTPLVNPPGYVLENYDAVGRWQTVDPLGGEIDATATVVFASGNMKEITSPLQMMQEIVATPRSRLIYSERLVSYLTGRLPNPSDACSVETISANLSQDGYTVLDAVAELTQADSFRLRAVGN